MASGSLPAKVASAVASSGQITASPAARPGHPTDPDAQIRAPFGNAISMPPAPSRLARDGGERFGSGDANGTGPALDVPANTPSGTKSTLSGSLVATDAALRVARPL
jgi:hypothetical protein